MNLRFYVKYTDELANESKRGVVFIKEIVPKPAIAFIANKIYNENYEALKMNHKWKISDNELYIKYGWEKGGRNKISLTADINDKKITEGSEEEFITEHYWGYTKAGHKKTFEYNVEHPKWNIYDVKNY